MELIFPYPWLHSNQNQAKTIQHFLGQGLTKCIMNFAFDYPCRTSLPSVHALCSMFYVLCSLYSYSSLPWIIYHLTFLLSLAFFLFFQSCFTSLTLTAQQSATDLQEAAGKWRRLNTRRIYQSLYCELFGTECHIGQETTSQWCKEKGLLRNLSSSGQHSIKVNLQNRQWLSKNRTIELIHNIRSSRIFNHFFHPQLFPNP